MEIVNKFCLFLISSILFEYSVLYIRVRQNLVDGVHYCLLT